MDNPLPKQPTDSNLLDDAANGDPVAFTRIVEEHQAMVYRTCLRLLRNEANAKDAAQATFIILHQKIEKLNRGTLLGGWLYQTSGLVCREFIRSTVRRNRREQEAMIMNETNANSDGDVWNTLRPELDLALTTLTPKYRDVVVLRYLEGKTTNETAAATNTSVSVVTTRLTRAMDQLRSWFQRRGIGVTAAGLSALLAEKASAASVPTSPVYSVPGATGAATAACSANTVLMVKGGLAKMASIAWLLWDALWFVAFVDCMNSWVGRGCPIPRWVHVFAVFMFAAGVAAMAILGVLGALSCGLAAACIFIPPGAAYVGWLWMLGPEMTSRRK